MYAIEGYLFTEDEVRASQRAITEELAELKDADGMLRADSAVLDTALRKLRAVLDRSVSPDRAELARRMRVEGFYRGDKEGSH